MAGQQTHPMVHFAVHENIVVGTLYKYSVLTPQSIDELANQLLGHVRTQPGINLLVDVSHIDYTPKEVLEVLPKGGVSELQANTLEGVTRCYKS